MQLEDALKKTAKRRSKVKTKRPRATVATMDRPYTNDIDQKKAVEIDSPHALVRKLVRRVAEDAYALAEKRIRQTVDRRLGPAIEVVKKYLKVPA